MERQNTHFFFFSVHSSHPPLTHTHFFFLCFYQVRGMMASSSSKDSNPTPFDAGFATALADEGEDGSPSPPGAAAVASVVEVGVSSGMEDVSLGPAVILATSPNPPYTWLLLVCFGVSDWLPLETLANHDTQWETFLLMSADRAPPPLSPVQNAHFFRTKLNTPPKTF